MLDRWTQWLDRCSIACWRAIRTFRSTRREAWEITVAIALITVLTACGSETVTRGRAPNSDTPQVSGRIGSAGGVIALMEGPARGAKITIPKGALDRMVTITMHAGRAPTNLPNDAISAGPVVVFGPEGQT